MKELDLFKFLKENEIEMRWDDEVLSIWLWHWHLEDFAKIVGTSLDEGGCDAKILSDGSLWLDLVPICEYYGIEPERIFHLPATV